MISSSKKDPLVSGSLLRLQRRAAGQLSSFNIAEQVLYLEKVTELIGSCNSSIPSCVSGLASLPVADKAAEQEVAAAIGHLGAIEENLVLVMSALLRAKSRLSRSQLRVVNKEKGDA